MIVINILVLGAKGPAHGFRFMDQQDRRCSLVERVLEQGSDLVLSGHMILGNLFLLSELCSCICRVGMASDSEGFCLDQIGRRVGRCFANCVAFCAHS